MRTSIKDVAKHANVSISTVSRVLKSDYPVSEELRERVHKAVKELNYIPHFIASSLKSKQVNILGVIIPSLTNSAIMRMAKAIEAKAKKEGYMTLFACSNNNEEDERQIINIFRSSMVDALVVATVLSDDILFKELITTNIPVILFDRQIETNLIDYVGENAVGASYELANYLINKGHRDILLLNGVPNVTVNIERKKGFTSALEDAGIKFTSENEICANFKEDLAYKRVKSFLENKKKEGMQMPTAIFSTNSLMTRGAISAVIESGLSIPDDISIVSYGDLHLPQNFQPSITCIKQDTDKIGETVTSLTLKRIEEKMKNETSIATKMLIPTTFFEGVSVKNLN